MNPNVPSFYKQSYLQGDVYDFSPDCKQRVEKSLFPPLRNAKNRVVCVPCSGPMQDCIVEKLRNNTSPVLRLFSL